MTLSLSFVKLSEAPDRSDFNCGTRELDSYFKNFAGQDVRRNLAAVTVLVDDAVKVVGFYTLSQNMLTVDLFPKKVGKNLPPKRDVPCTLLGRLAVDQRYRGQGFGEILLLHALKKAAQTSEDVASFAVIVDAKDDKAVLFYEKYGFVRFKDTPMRLFIPVKDIKTIEL